VISLDLAHRLRDAGVPWTPTAGDRFVVPDREMDDQVFVVSDMVVEVHELPSGPLLRFNGTTEWALDSIEQHEVVWLPREEQLRELLGDAFRALEATPGGFIVRLTREGHEERHIDIDAECALARAVLALAGS
jgi:hypothetical protein